MLKKGTKHKDIAEALGISKYAVDRISSFYKREGAKCLNEKVRGRKPGEKRQLSPEQEKEIQYILIDKYPNQLKLNFMLWTRAAVCELIRNRYGITITLRNMSEYLKRWGMTCQRPTKKAYFQDNVKLNTFMHETYPAIVEKAKKEDAEIYRGDETGINNQAYHIKGYSHKDEIEIFFMSPYSPEINPDEYLNHNLMQNIHSGIIPHTKEQIRKKTEAYMHGLQEQKERVTSLFKHKKLNYIAKYSC